MSIRNTFFLALIAGAAMLSCSRQSVYMVSTTRDNPWMELISPCSTGAGKAETLVIDLDRKGQAIEGFGTCFSELSHRALSRVSEKDREKIMADLFSPGAGACFTVCRTPIGASDFALKYYSYDDSPGDFSMEHFTVENDRETLIPLIKSALSNNPRLKIWASPWCPPSWMKVNGHYASRPIEGTSPSGRKRLELDNLIRDNGLTSAQRMHEGEDSFIMEDRYLDAYALYFRKYIKAYREEGIDIFMVMPQNEFNSDQNFPSCTWTAKGLTAFMQRLVPAMKEEGVEVYFGTMERGNRALADTVLTDPTIGGDIKGAAFQWAGMEAIPLIHASYPGLMLVMSEQKCFNGANCWEDFMTAWDLMKYNLDNGVSIYDYWNLALLDGEVSTWGWQQNSLVSVDYETGAYKYNYEFYQMKHISRHVKPGAVYLGTSGSFTQALAFLNPDGTIAVLAAEKTDAPVDLAIHVGEKTVNVTLPPGSVSSIVFEP